MRIFFSRKGAKLTLKTEIENEDRRLPTETETVN